MYALSKTSLPMDVEFMMSDTFEVGRLLDSRPSR